MLKLPTYLRSTTVLYCLLTIFTSCGENTDNLKESNSADEVGSDSILDLVSSPTDRIEDLEALFNEGETSKALSVIGADVEKDNELLVNSTSVSAPKPDILLNDPQSKLLMENTEAEKALQNLEDSALEHQKSIEELRKINAHKDKTIASLSTINDELLSEIQRIKGGAARVGQTKISKLPPDSNVVDLRSEVKNLRNSLMLKSTEIRDLRVRNDSLEQRISSLENSPTQSISLADPEYAALPQSDLRKNFITENMTVRGCTVNFDAVVTSYNGKSKEAFYSEFFVLNRNLNDLLSEQGIDLSLYSGVENYAELWAQSRKNSFLYPDLQKNIRNILLAEVDKGNGKRVRTDINGAATVQNLTKGNYFIIGTAALGKIGVTWNVPVSLNNGINKVSLTLANASWSK